MYASDRSCSQDLLYRFSNWFSDGVVVNIGGAQMAKNWVDERVEEICPECGEAYSDCECEEEEDPYPAPPSKAYPRLDIDFDELPF